MHWFRLSASHAYSLVVWFRFQAYLNNCVTLQLAQVTDAKRQPNCSLVEAHGLMFETPISKHLLV